MDMANGVKLGEHWLFQVTVLHRCHWRLAAHYARTGRLYGIPVVIFATIVGSSVFATLESSGYIELRIIAGGLSMTAAILAGLQTWFNYPKRAENHRGIAIKLGDLRRDIEKVLRVNPQAIQSKTEEFDKLDKKWQEAVRDSPAIPDWMYKSVKRQSRKEG